MSVLNSFRRYALVCGALWALSGACFAQDALKVAIMDVKPYGVVNPQGAPTGIYVDLMEAIAKEAGLSVQVDVFPFARAGSHVASGAYDATISFNTEALEGKATPITEVMRVEQVVLFRPELKNIASGSAGSTVLSTLELARLPGGCTSLNLKTLGPKMQDVPSIESGLRMTIAKRVDGFCAVKDVLIWSLDDLGLASYYRDAQVRGVGENVVWLWGRKDLPPALVTRLTLAVASVQSKGVLAAIQKKYSDKLSRDSKKLWNDK